MNKHVEKAKELRNATPMVHIVHKQLWKFMPMIRNQ